MPDIQTEVDLLIGERGRSDPRLHAAIVKLNSQLSRLTLMVEPLVVQSELEDEAEVEATVDLSSPNVSYEFTGRTVRLSWDAVENAVYYEIRVGTDWKTASFQARTVNRIVDLDPIAVGTTTYLIKSISGDLGYSSDTTIINVIVPIIPAIGIEKETIDNTVLLRWAPPPSVFRIDYYELFRGNNSIGTTRDTFFTRFETAGGDYVYKIIAYDLYGNKSEESTIEITLNPPVDYVLQHSQISDLDGAKVNTLLIEGGQFPVLFASIRMEPWSNHFQRLGWNAIKDQINAGYPYYLQPTNLTGSYEELIDFEVVFSFSLITVSWNTIQLDDNNKVLVRVELSWSEDGVAYSAFTAGSSQLVSNVRYLKVRLEFTAPDDHASIRIFELSIFASVKREQDGGEIEALSTDTNGTPVLFKKDFKDIESVTATVKDTLAYIPVVDFLDTPNPSGFTVYVFDRLGVRASKTVEWSARGII